MDDKELETFFGGTKGASISHPRTTWEHHTTIERPAEDNDLVNHPKHYTSHPSGIECIEVTQHYNFCIGNAIKYLWRNGLKAEASLDSKDKQIQDLEKAIWYINREISNLQTNVYE